MPEQDDSGQHVSLITVTLLWHFTPTPAITLYSDLKTQGRREQVSIDEVFAIQPRLLFDDDPSNAGLWIDCNNLVLLARFDHEYL